MDTKTKKYNKETKQCINNYNYYTEYSINDYISNSYNNYSNIDENAASNLLDKECYYTCKTCEIMGDNKSHNCLECNSDFYFRINFNNYINCYKSCEYYYYFDNDNKYYYCTINSSCPKEYSKLLKDKNECIKYDFKNIINNIIIPNKNETKIKDKNEEINYYNSILKNIENVFTDENYDTSNLDKGEDEVIETEKMTITFTTIQNQKNNINNNITTIDLGICEEILRKSYNISENETLYMKKIDIFQEKMKIPKLEYDVYCKLNGTNLIKLDLSLCENTKISLSIPVIISKSENLDKLNSSSGYFNNICYSSTSD